MLVFFYNVSLEALFTEYLQVLSKFSILLYEVMSLLAFNKMQLA